MPDGASTSLRPRRPHEWGGYTGAARPRLPSSALSPRASPMAQESSKSKEQLPKYEALIRPSLRVLKSLGGSATVDEFDLAVTRLLGLSEAQLQVPHNSKTDTRTEIEYRLAWTRTILKTAGLLNNSARGVWVLADPHVDPGSVDPAAVLRRHRQEYRSRKAAAASAPEGVDVDGQESDVPDLDWREELLKTVRGLQADQFERLAMRLLREAGFTQVDVTGRVGDGGIDGKGIIRLQGIVSFHVVFQCKKYARTVSPEEIRAFRGAIEGRADRGLFITSGRFTAGAVAEATREGARPVDLVDGVGFAEMLRQYGLGVTVSTVEHVKIESDWFSKI